MEKIGWCLSGSYQLPLSPEYFYEGLTVSLGVVGPLATSCIARFLKKRRNHRAGLALRGRVGSLNGNFAVLSRRYVARQVASLLAFAQSTKDKRLSAVLVEKAADLKAQADEVPERPDISPIAPMFNATPSFAENRPGPRCPRTCMVSWPHGLLARSSKTQASISARRAWSIRLEFRFDHLTSVDGEPFVCSCDKKSSSDGGDLRVSARKVKVETECDSHRAEECPVLGETGRHRLSGSISQFDPNVWSGRA